MKGIFKGKTLEYKDDKDRIIADLRKIIDDFTNDGLMDKCKDYLAYEKEIKEMKEALKVCKAVIIDNAPDTVWQSDCTTMCDYIDNL